MGTKHQRKQRPISEKERHTWLTSLAAVNAWAKECPETQFISVGDAEADVYDLFCAPREANVALLVRAAQNRCVAPEAREDRLLRAQVAHEPVGWTTSVAVPRHAGQPARTAEVTVRWRSFTLQPPAHRVKESLPSVTLWAVWVHEEAAPAGGEALDWLLWTSLPTETQAQAAQIVDYYRCRWGVEVWHHVLKSGCAIEARQLESVEALRRSLALFSVIAWRILYATLLARAAPDVPCTVLLAVEEWQALYCAIHKTATPPTTTPTVREAVRWLARLGGFLGRKGDGEPGPQVLWRGFQRLPDLTRMYQVFAPPPTRRKCGQ